MEIDEKLFDEIKLEKNLADPQPKSNPTRKTSTNTRPVGRPSKQSRESELQKEIEGFLMLATMPLRMRDYHTWAIPENGDMITCADMFVEFAKDGSLVLTAEAKQLAAAFAHVAVDNKFLSKFFDMGDDVGKWLSLAMALQPFILGFMHNHVRAKKVIDAS